ncbi:MAG TPA: hypothetical protein VGW57_14520 [Chthoniobacterales bacterium]|nr:hypothetical protein [Chthoniobacterales bacterium]
MRQPDGDFLIRRADVRDAAVIAAHRARMFHDIDEISDKAFEDFRKASQAWTERALESGEYIGWLAALKGEPDKVVAGAGVQLRQAPPHPCRPPRDGAFAKGRHAIVLNGTARLLRFSWGNAEEILSWIPAGAAFHSRSRCRRI